MTICFTGRRPKDLCGYKKERYNQLVQDLADRLTKLVQDAKEPVRFISGGAQGFDQLAFWAVNIVKTRCPELNIQNDVFVPFKGQERQWLKTGLFSQNEFQLMLKHADNVIYLNEELTEKKEIVQALLNRNHAMVDASDKVIALYPDDTWDVNRGGTAECMRYASQQDKEILQLTYALQNDQVKITGEKTANRGRSADQPAKFQVSSIGQEMLKLQDDLAKQYSYKKQPETVAEYNMQNYLRTLPEEFKSETEMNGKGYSVAGHVLPLISKDGTKIADKYDRIVVGQYGAFIEIDNKGVMKNNFKVKPGEEYRITSPQYAERVKYQWFTTKDVSNCKLYFQMHEVVYADYKPNKWYISPYEVCSLEELKELGAITPEFYQQYKNTMENGLLQEGFDPIADQNNPFEK